MSPRRTLLRIGCYACERCRSSCTPFHKTPQVLEKAYELGITHFDTAEIYTGKNAAGEERHNEVLVGKFLKKVGRDKV